jgi:phenylacetate-CoA ligase
MNLGLLSNVLVMRSRWRRRDHWGVDQIAAHQKTALERLRGAAYSGSEFYRRHHAGLMDAPLSELPSVTKADIMANFDQVVTVPGLHLTDVEEHLQTLRTTSADPGTPWHGMWAAATAGTTGRKGVFVWNRKEWATILTSYARANEWAGVKAGLSNPLRVAFVSSRVPTHQSAVVGASLRAPFISTLRLDATMPISEMVAALNAFQPRVLVGYASALGPLAAEQIAGHLVIAPQSVMSASEVLSPTAALQMTAAWGAPPFDVYAATETAGIASPCIFRNSHIYEDLLIVEPVDEAGKAVPPGTTGARILVTVLFSRTIPLIRYELSDRVAVGGRGCPCGRGFALLGGIEGRLEDVLFLPGKAGRVRVHPLVFHRVLDEVSVRGWQVIQESAGLRILLAGLVPGLSAEKVGVDVTAALSEAGVTKTAVDVHIVEAVERTALGKAPLIRALSAP